MSAGHLADVLRARLGIGAWLRARGLAPPLPPTPAEILAAHGITDVEVVDPHTVRFRFKAAYSHQLTDAIDGKILPVNKLELTPRRKTSDVQMHEPSLMV